MKHGPWKRALCALLLLFGMLAVSACSQSGDRLCSFTTGGLTYEVYGRETGIRRIEVSGAFRATVKMPGHIDVDEPYTADDGLHYGLTVCDVDADGDDDLLVCTRRTEGREKYLFFLSDGAGTYRENALLSSLTAPKLLPEEGIVSASEKTTIVSELSTPNAPPMYQIRSITRRFTADGKGGILCSGADEISFYSEGNIYCLATYRPAEPGEIPDDEEYALVIVDEHWIPAEKIAKYGIEPLE